MENKKWAYSFYEIHDSEYDYDEWSKPFNTREEAIDDAKKQWAYDKYKYLYVASCNEYVDDFEKITDDLIYNIRYNAGKYADIDDPHEVDYMNLKDEHRKILVDRVAKEITEWKKKYRYDIQDKDVLIIDKDSIEKLYTFDNDKGDVK